MGRFFSFLISIPYSIVSSLRNLFFDLDIFSSYQASMPVISVGNLSIGGSGKSPLVQYLVRVCLERGLEPVIFLRGYSGKLVGPHLVRETDTAKQVGDEALMHFECFKGKVPVVVARRRVLGAKLIEQTKLGNVIILDDGFQHRWLARDLDLLVQDVSTERSRSDWSLGTLLPLGRFRERKSPALRRADLIVFTSRGSFGSAFKAVTHEKSGIVAQLVPSGFLDIFSGESLSLSHFTGQRGIGLTAIASSERFFDMLKTLGIVLEQTKSFRDHFLYTEELWQEFQGKLVFTTKKDAVKLRPFLSKSDQAFALELDYIFPSTQDEQTLLSLLDKKNVGRSYEYGKGHGQ